MSIEGEIFEDRPKEGFGLHNVGPGVLRASDPGVIEMVANHYGPRCGHVPSQAEGRTGFIVYQATELIEGQLEYLRKITGRKFEQVDLSTFKTPGGLVVPYINDPATEKMLQERGARVWGLPSSMVNKLKNKAESHLLMERLKIPGLNLPMFEISDVDQIQETSLNVLAKSENLYIQAGMANTYPRGVIIRAAESDGNYGACIVAEKGGHIDVIPDGDPNQMTTETDWGQALGKATTHLKSTMNLGMERRVVVSRLIDLEDSPGMSVFVVDGKVRSLGWNGQVHPDGGTACVGTSTYVPPTEIAREAYAEEKENSEKVFEDLLRQTAKECGVDFGKIRGAANVDLMIPGQREIELQKRIGQKPGLYLAEINPRLTNLTDGLMLALWVRQQPITVSNMLDVLDGGFLTVDKFKYSKSVDPQEMRDRVFAVDKELARDGTRVICRMPDNPMGLILMGDVKRAQKRLNLLQEE